MQYKELMQYDANKGKLSDFLEELSQALEGCKDTFLLHKNYLSTKQFNTINTFILYASPKIIEFKEMQQKGTLASVKGYLDKLNLIAKNINSANKYIAKKVKKMSLEFQKNNATEQHVHSSSTNDIKKTTNTIYSLQNFQTPKNNKDDRSTYKTIQKSASGDGDLTNTGSSETGNIPVSIPDNKSLNETPTGDSTSFLINSQKKHIQDSTTVDENLIKFQSAPPFHPHAPNVSAEGYL